MFLWHHLGLHILMCQRLKYITSGVIQSRSEEIRLTLFVGAMLYFDVSVFHFISGKSEEMRAAKPQGENNTGTDPTIDLLYFQCLMRLAETVFCMIKMSLYAYTSYMEQFASQENLFFLSRIAKFAATTYIFYRMVLYMTNNYGLSITGVAFEIAMIVKKASKYMKAFQERARLTKTLKQYIRGKSFALK